MKSFDRFASAGHLTSWVSRLFERTAEKRLRPLGLSAGQVPVMLILAGETRLSQKQLVQRAAVEQPAMAALLNRMERGGLVRRTRDPADGRSFQFELTEQCRSRLDQLFIVLARGNEEALAGFSAEERAALFAMLRRMLENLQETAGRPGPLPVDADQ